jgi:hypothetical protein
MAPASGPSTAGTTSTGGRCSGAEHDLARRHQPPAHDAAGRVEGVDEVGQPEGEPVGEAVEELEGVGVALGGGGGDLDAGDVLGVAAGQLDEAAATARGHELPGLAVEGGAGGVALPAAAPTARAREAVVVDDHVADLPGEAVGPPYEQAVDDEAAADPGAEGDEESGVRAGGGAQLVLGPRRARGVVVGPHREAQRLGQARPEGQLHDPGQVGREAQGAVPVDQPGRPHAHGGDPGRAVEERGGHRHHARQQAVGVAHGRLPVLGHDGPVVVEDDPEDLRPPDVQPERGHARSSSAGGRRCGRGRRGRRCPRTPRRGTTG